MPETPEFHPAFVVPRYGLEVVGGAEDLARRTAEELARRGYAVTALTTRALDHHTWKNHFPEGSSELNGVSVMRFGAQTRVGDPTLSRIVSEIDAGEDIGVRDQLRWLEGAITSDGLFDHLGKHGDKYTHIIFLPYLFGTTYFGSRIHPERSYIIGCLHDEPFAHLELVREMLRGVKGLIFNSPGEKRLASRLLSEDDPGPVVGMGFRRKSGDPAAFRNRTGVRGDFVLYAGRREEGKNTPLLVEYACRLAADSPGLASLVLMGAGAVGIPPGFSSIVFDLGRATEAEKWDGYGAASIFCQPSVNESLSIVLLESWLAGTPALVHRDCAVTSDHVLQSGGGLTFSDYPEFAEAVKALLEDPYRAMRIGEAGRSYVEEEYNWDAVIERLLAALGVMHP